MKLIVGLGNPGPGYAANRHNVGFICLNHFARAHGIHWDKKQGLARTGGGVVAGNPVVLARPQTYMNLSGQAVARLARRYGLIPEDITVIHDDLDLPVGRIRLRPDGGSGGHQGIESIVAELGSRDFVRIRVGIGRPAGSGEASEAAVIDYVLGDFTAGEKAVIDEVIPRVGQAILCLITEGLTAAMNNYNR